MAAENDNCMESTVYGYPAVNLTARSSSHAVRGNVADKFTVRLINI